ncbi:MAG: RDD family protein [Acidimicrobiales bacterium]|nr:RDD family protein [Acidimicrobiales bacterium]
MSNPNPLDRLLGAIVNPVVGAVDVGEVIGQVDVDQLVAEVDVNAVIERVDVDAVVKRVDVDDVIARVDVDTVIGRVDIDQVIQRVDMQAVLARVDLDEVLGKVDLDALLAKVDVAALLDRIDADALVQRIDLNALMERVDLDAMLRRVDVQDLMARANIDSIVRDASKGVFARSIDAIRRQVVGLDALLIGVVTRVFRRRREQDRIVTGESVTGQVAGGVSRLAAYLIDVLVITTGFSITTAVIGYLLSLFLTERPDPSLPGLLALGGYAGFSFVYFAVGLIITGRSVGKGVVGLKVVALDGSPISPGRAIVRGLVYPFSFILGLGLLPIVVGRHRRALHDWAGRDKVLYDWGDRPAELPAPLTDWVRRRAAAEAAEDTPAPEETGPSAVPA